jgi:ABC-type multidrug transport system ATPase subunit
MIRSAFKDSTILSISHRLNSVTDADRIIVLDSGGVAEYGSPIALYQKPLGIFRSMCDAARLVISQDGSKEIEEVKDDERMTSPSEGNKIFSVAI